LRDIYIPECAWHWPCVQSSFEKVDQFPGSIFIGVIVSISKQDYHISFEGEELTSKLKIITYCNIFLAPIKRIIAFSRWNSKACIVVNLFWKKSKIVLKVTNKRKHRQEDVKLWQIRFLSLNAWRQVSETWIQKRSTGWKLGETSLSTKLWRHIHTLRSISCFYENLVWFFPFLSPSAHASFVQYFKFFLRVWWKYCFR